MTIGEGSFSSVYRVRQKILDRWVAVKILHEKDRERRLELLNEARNQAQMSIACIPAVYDAFAQGQQLFIVMEWIKGASLQSLLEKGIPGQSDRAPWRLPSSRLWPDCIRWVSPTGHQAREHPGHSRRGNLPVDFASRRKWARAIDPSSAWSKGDSRLHGSGIWQGRGNVDS